MGQFSIWHWISVLFIIADLAMIVHISVSSRTQGWKKALFVIAALLIPLIPYLVWLVARQSATEAIGTAKVKEAEARALQAEAEAREAEARARIFKANTSQPGSVSAQAAEADQALVSEAASQFLRTGTVEPIQLRLLLAASKQDQTLLQLADRIRGNTLLHYCASRGLDTDVASLLACGADRTARNGDGKTAAQVAATETIRAKLNESAA